MKSGHHQYDPKTGRQLDGATFDIKYGSGFAKGDIYRDKVTLGGITVTQAIGCATSLDNTVVKDLKLDGILGLGFNSGSSKVNYGYPQPASATRSALNAGKSTLFLENPIRSTS